MNSFSFASSQEVLSDRKRVTTRSLLPIHPIDTDTGRNYSCVATNLAAPSGKSTTVTLNVHRRSCCCFFLNRTANETIYWQLMLCCVQTAQALDSKNLLLSDRKQQRQHKQLVYMQNQWLTHIKAHRKVPQRVLISRRNTSRASEHLRRVTHFRSSSC